MDTHIRWMIRPDMPDVMAVELASFDHAWTEDDFLECLSHRSCIGMVALIGDTIVGFMIYELSRTCVRLLNFAVHPDYRRTGVGCDLMAKLAYKVCSHRREKLTAAVREGNTGAQLFFRVMGLTATRVLRGYYEDSGEDAYEFVYSPTAKEWDRFGGAPVNRIATYHE